MLNIHDSCDSLIRCDMIMTHVSLTLRALMEGCKAKKTDTAKDDKLAGLCTPEVDVHIATQSTVQTSLVLQCNAQKC